MDPEIGKHPTEFYGYPWFNDNPGAKESRENEWCPYQDTRCTKRRKSNNDITIGTCSVGYRGRGQDEYRAHVICPDRFRTQNVFDPVEDLFVDAGEYFLVPEVSLLGTSIDFVAGKIVDGEVSEFAGIEIQSIDSTGSIWDHKVAYENDEDMDKVDRTYGMNWAMSITKTMMQQAFKKGQAFREWNENLIFLLQDVSLDYLRGNANTSRLQPVEKDDPVHFYSYSFTYDYSTEQYEWSLSEKLSTSLEGVSQMMDASEEQKIPTKDEFKQDIMNKF